MHPRPHRRATALVPGNGYISASIAQRQEWQQRCIDAADQERLLRAAGVRPERGLHIALPSLGLAARLGGALVRLGTRLQGTPETTSQLAR